eukprot:1161955-Pelagomonas_calceolata.AAC.1
MKDRPHHGAMIVAVLLLYLRTQMQNGHLFASVLLAYSKGNLPSMRVLFLARVCLISSLFLSQFHVFSCGREGIGAMQAFDHAKKVVKSRNASSLYKLHLCSAHIQENKLLHQWECNDIADRRAVCEKHHQSVNADAQAASGGHTMLQGSDKIIIHLHLRGQQDGLSVRSITCLSIPMPRPPVGGMPCS